MRIGLILSSEAPESNGGVKVQGIMWKRGLEMIGHQCELVDFWKNYDWDSFDVIIILGFGGTFRTMTQTMRKLSKKLVLAPIIDPIWGHVKYKFFAKYWGSHKYLGLTSRFKDLYLNRNLFDCYLVRSDYEASYVERCLDIPKDKIKIVPLSVRTPILKEMPQKENFCFHASRLAAENKNINRLVAAAVKYKFPLFLAGSLNGVREQKWLDSLIVGYDNIQYLGKLSDDDLVEWYTKAKVFTLPSLTEGVGMVALEAAGRGCEIVVTNDGGPQYYFKNRAYIVNPYSIDEIGESIIDALHESKYQPDLLHYISDNYSLESCSYKLFNSIS